MFTISCVISQGLWAQSAKTVSKSLSALVKKQVPQTQCLLLEGEGILQIGVPPKTIRGNDLAEKVCLSLQKNEPQSAIRRVILEDGITAYGSCDCQSGKKGFDTVKDRSLGYYYFAGQ